MTAGGGTFRIDPEVMPQVVSDLKEARQHLTDLIAHAGELAEHGTVGADVVSVNAARQFQRLGLEPGAGGLADAVTAYQRALDESIEAMETTLKGYLHADELTLPHAATFGPTPLPGPAADRTAR